MKYFKGGGRGSWFEVEEKWNFWGGGVSNAELNAFSGGVISGTIQK